MEENHDVGQEGLDNPVESPDFEWDDAQDSEASSAVERVEELPSLNDDEYLLVLPGGQIEIELELPKRRKSPKALVLHAGCLIVCDGKRRSTVRTPASTVDDPELPLAWRLVMVFIARRSVTPRTRGRRYLAVTDESGELLDWIDHSPPGWDFQTSQVRAVAQYAGLECSTERFAEETEFELAHPNWVR